MDPHRGARATQPDTGADGAGAPGSGSGAGAGSLTDRAYEHLREALVLLEIRPGAPLDDDVLAAELGIGRTPVRDAFKRLEHDRLVVSYPRRGTFATPVDLTDLGHLSELRRELEPMAARTAARRAGHADRETLRTLAADIEAVDTTTADRRALIRLDVAAHHAIYRSGGNPHLEHVSVRLHSLTARIWCLVLDRLSGLGGFVDEHGELLRAVADGRADDAARLAVEHVDGFERAVRDVL